MVLHLVARDGGLDHAQHGELVTRITQHERLYGNPSGLEDRTQHWSRQPCSRAVDVRRTFTRRHAAPVQHDLAALDPLHVTQANEVLDPAQKLQFSLTDHHAAVQGRSDVGIDAKKQSL